MTNNAAPAVKKNFQTQAKMRVWERPKFPDFSLYQTVRADMGEAFADNPRSRVRPYLLWARIKDEEGRIQAVEGVFPTTQLARKRVRPQDLLIADSYLRDLWGGGDKDLILPFDSLHSLRCAQKTFGLSKKDQSQERQDNYFTKIDPILIPDMVLRRAYALLYTEESEKLVREVPCLSDWRREGIHFKDIRQENVRSDRVEPDTADYALAQSFPADEMPFSQAEIDRIARIAKNYSQFCRAKSLPVIWPRPGTYGQWPASFMAFQKPKKGHVDLRWTQHVGQWQNSVLKRHRTDAAPSKTPRRQFV